MAVAAVYLDECVDQRMVALLRARGIQVSSVLEAGTLGDDDATQLEFATRQDRVLVSHNARDFRRLHAEYQQQARPYGGILLLPSGVPEVIAIRSATMLDWIAGAGDHRSQLFRWHDLQSWLTQGNRLPGYDPVEVRLALGQES